MMNYSSAENYPGASVLDQLDEPAVLDLLKRKADLIDIRFSEEFKVCTYRLDDLMIEVRQNRRRIEELAVSVLGTTV